MDRIMQLRPVEYEMISDPLHSGFKTGFIAQEVKALFPELVGVIKDTLHATGYKNITDLHTLDYTGFGVLAIKAIQEQQSQIEDLKKENARLQTKLDAIAKKLDEVIAGKNFR